MDNKDTNKDKLTKELENENDAMKQSVMVARILADVSQQYERYFKRMWIVLIISILTNIALVGSFLWYESQWEYETSTTTTTIEQDTGTGNGNNIYQSGESAQYHEAGKEDMNDGETKDSDYKDNQNEKAQG